jgi:hypothetical protein
MCVESKAAQAAPLLVLLVLLAGCPSPPPDLPRATPLTEKEAEALDMVRVMLDIDGTSGESIWPGFSARSIPLLVFRPSGRSFVVGLEQPPPESEPITVAGFGTPVFLVDSSKLGLSAGLPFARETRVLNVDLFVVRHKDTDGKEDWFRLLVHELFHRYQYDHWEKTEFPEECRYPYDSDENSLLSFAEEKLLVSLLDGIGTHPADTAGLAALYVEIRGRRKALPGSGSAAAAIEEWEELSEGTARYVEDKYAVAAGFTDGKRVAAVLKAYLQQGFKPQNLQKWKYYRTGETLALALEALAVPDWKEACAGGWTPLATLAKAVAEARLALDPAQLEKLAVLPEAERQTVREAVEKYLEEERQLIDRWQKEGKVKVTVILPDKGAAYYVNRGMTFLLDDCSRLATGIVSFVDNRFGLEVFGKGMALRNIGPGYRVVFHDDLAKGSLVVEAGELDVAQDGETRFADGIAAEFAGWHLRSSEQGKVTRRGNELTIEILP